MKTEGKLTQRQWYSKQGVPLFGFDVVNSVGVVLALGSLDPSNGFVVMRTKRYEHDGDLVAAIERLTGLKVRVSPEDQTHNPEASFEALNELGFKKQRVVLRQVEEPIKDYLV